MSDDTSTTARCSNCARLERRIAELEQLLEKATRAQKRQAAPFSKGTPKENPKKPGRKPGDHYGPKAHRPLPEQEPNEIIDVPLPERCPECGGLAEEDHVDQCLEHLLRRAEALLERATRGAVRFPRKVREFLSDALALRDRRDRGTISSHGLAVASGRLDKRLDRLLEWNLSHPGNHKFQKHLAGHRDQILTFLYDPDIEATNWPAEQAVRPAVVNRKVFGGNRTTSGGHAQEILGSVFATLTKRAVDTLSFLSNIIRSPADQRPGLIHQLLSAPTVDPSTRYTDTSKFHNPYNGQCLVSIRGM